MKVIGLTGFAKSGKSTAAEILKSLGGQEVAFAKHLKDVCSVVFDVQRSHFDDQAFKEVPFNVHRFLDDYYIEKILNYFEVPARFTPHSQLTHRGVPLTSPRQVAQYVGTEVLRSIDPNIHINMAFKLNANSTAKFLICSDVRFENELKSVQDSGGIIIGISRKAAIPANIESLHPSEKEIPDLIRRSDPIIFNEFSIQDLQDVVKTHALSYLESK